MFILELKMENIQSTHFKNENKQFSKQTIAICVWTSFYSLWMARNERCKGGQGKTELENGGKRRGEMEEKEGKDKKKMCREENM